MARILVKTVDANSEDPEKDMLLYKRGDVVKVAQDGYHFGRKIETDRNTKFAIIELPGVPVARLASLVEPEATGTGDTYQLVRRRTRKIDLVSMTPQELEALEGLQRKIQLAEARLNQLVRVKPPLDLGGG